MSIITLTSAKGSPGVSAAALGIALAWPRPCLLVEADVAGGSSVLAGYLRGTVQQTNSTLDLALAAQRGYGLDHALHGGSIPLPNSTVRVIPALDRGDQAATIAELWEQVAAVLHGLDRQGIDVIVDAGRLGMAGGPDPLLTRSNLVLLVTRTHLPAIAATRARARILHEQLDDASAGLDGLLGLLVIGEGQPYSNPEVTAAVKLPIHASLAWDPVNAEVLSLGATTARWDKSRLHRSIQDSVWQLRGQLYGRQQLLDASRRGAATQSTETDRYAR